MSNSQITRRQFVGGYLVAVGTAGIGGCGGSNDEPADAQKATTPGGEPEPGNNPPSSGNLPSEAAPPVGVVLTSLKVVGTTAGRFPYSATVLPRRGEVPEGSSIESPDDGTLRATVLSTHDDRSAAVVVVSGVVTVPAELAATVRLQAGPARNDSALSPSAIGALVSNVSIAFGGDLGTASISKFDSPEFVWWANARNLCARYRVASPNPGTTSLEAVIDIHLWADRAFVEVVVENARMKSASPVKPSAANYAGATVTINAGAPIATVNSSDVPAERAHSAFRAWYAGGWVGGNPGLRVTQDVSDLQQHPLLFKMDQLSSADLSGYAADKYVPWFYGRKPDAYMGGVGDVPGIGPLTQWDARWLQSGDARVANAVEQQALMTLHWNINFRDSGTGKVPTHAEIDLKSFNGNRSWPSQGNSANALEWELMHHPSVGLAAFLVRPSPIFIELAQKIAIWNALYPTNWDNNTVQPTGVFRGGACSTRGRAWGLRSLGHAIFLTPDSHMWKAAAKPSLIANIDYLHGYRTDAKSKLNVSWEGDPALPQNLDFSVAADGPAFVVRGWFHHYLITEVHKLASARLLTGAPQLSIEFLADWLCGFPVRWVNEQPNGGWRYLPYTTVIGQDPQAVNMPSDWGTIRDYTHSDSPPAVAGPWFFGTGTATSYAGSYGSSDLNRPRYVDYFWAALVAAAERNIPGAYEAWTSVNAKVTNLQAWRTGFGVEPRWGATPRSLPTQQIFASGPDAGSYDASTFTWTPGTSDGVVNSSSWAIVPKRTWVRAVGTNLTALDNAVRTASPSWTTSQLNWDGLTNSWSGIVPDANSGRVWFMGGGHTNGWQNGLYRFDALRMAWAIERAPSDRSAWPTDYASGSSATNFGPSAAQFTSDVAASRWTPINGSFYDQLADGRPTARHTYQSMVYDGGRNQLVMACRRLWKFDLASGDWSYRRAVNDLSAGGDGTGSGFLDNENSVGIYDEAKERYLTQASGSGGRNSSIQYNLAANAWVTRSLPWSNRAVYLTRNGRTVLAWSPGGGDNSFHQNGNYWLYDLDSDTALASNVECQLGGGLTYSYFNPPSGSGGKEGHIEFIPPLNRYWLTVYTSAGAWEFFELDPTTRPFTLTKIVLPGAMPKQPDWLFRRMVYMANINALMLFGFASEQVSVYRF